MILQWNFDNCDCGNKLSDLCVCYRFYLHSVMTKVSKHDDNRSIQVVFFYSNFTRAFFIVKQIFFHIHSYVKNYHRKNNWKCLFYLRKLKTYFKNFNFYKLCPLKQTTKQSLTFVSVHPRRKHIFWGLSNTDFHGYHSLRHVLSVENPSLSGSLSFFSQNGSSHLLFRLEGRATKERS